MWEEPVHRAASTIGLQRIGNVAVLEADEDRFVAMLLSGQPAIPAYFAFDAQLNRRTRSVLHAEPSPVPLSPQRLRALVGAGARVVDTRAPHEFAAGHLDGSINVGIDGRFAETAGMVFGPGDRIIIVAPAGRPNEVALRLARIGFDDVAGYLEHGASDFPGLPDLRRVAERVEPDELDRREMTVVDVRNPGERAQGAIPGSLAIPLADIPRRLAEIPVGLPVIVYCAGGWRSSVAASVLRAHGMADVADLVGGYAAWQQMHDA